MCYHLILTCQTTPSSAFRSFSYHMQSFNVLILNFYAKHCRGSGLACKTSYHSGYLFERLDPSVCRFNFLFLKRFWLIMRVAVPGVYTKSLLLLVMLIVARAAGQWRKCMVHDGELHVVSVAPHVQILCSVCFMHP